MNSAKYFGATPGRTSTPVELDDMKKVCSAVFGCVSCVWNIVQPTCYDCGKTVKIAERQIYEVGNHSQLCSTRARTHTHTHIRTHTVATRHNEKTGVVCGKSSWHHQRCATTRSPLTSNVTKVPPFSFYVRYNTNTRTYIHNTRAHKHRTHARTHMHIIDSPQAPRSMRSIGQSSTLPMGSTGSPYLSDPSSPPILLNISSAHWV
jgi:hypothetical protein